MLTSACKADKLQTVHITQYETGASINRSDG